MDDALYMTEAFDLAEKGRGSTHPNPLVGAVLVKDGVVVGRGWHLAPGEPHAEAMALAQAGEAARGATLYCTLEPCSHQGKTPPCADALVAAGVERAVVALRDPDPRVDGAGFRKLRDGGVVVDLAEERWGARARRQNAPFLKFNRENLPLVTYKAAVSLDGKVAAQGGDARWISCLDSRRAVHELRARADAVMVGAGTVRRDDPELTVRLSDGRDPVRVVITSDGELPPGAKLLATARKTRTIVVAREATPAARRLLEARGAELVEVGDGGLRAALAGARRTRPPRRALRGRPHAGRRAPGRGPHRPGAAVRGAAHRRARRARPVRGPCRGLRGARLEAHRRGVASGVRRPPAERRRREGGRLMFTGIVEEIGTLRRVTPGAESVVLDFDAATVTEDAAVGDSILTDGVCLTVTSLRAGGFTADAMPETVRRTTLSERRPGDRLNLERALTLRSRLGGHLVSGHVDGVGTVRSVTPEDNALVVEIEAPDAVSRVTVDQGSVAVDGVSLTVVGVAGDRLRVSLIPHTAAVTTLGRVTAGVRVNLEADLIAKYVYAFVSGRKPEAGLTWEKLAEAGF